MTARLARAVVFGECGLDKINAADPSNKAEEADQQDGGRPEDHRGSASFQRRRKHPPSGVNKRLQTGEESGQHPGAPGANVGTGFA